jgi:DNA processing protein
MPCVPLRHWLQLSLTRGLGPILTGRLVALAGSAASACDAGATLLREVDGVGKAKADVIAAGLREAARLVDDELEKVAHAGASAVCPDDAGYPLLLRSIPDPPAVLYLRGELQPRDLHAVAIVGSRKCSVYGREQAERFGALLAGAGLCVVSGGARGIDTSAHRGAMAQPGGRTIAVLGTGVDVAYPPENAPLFDKIAAGGGVVASEYPIGTRPAAENFPRRNRIISGMSRGVIVVEADERSGALITARQACDDHGRPVFAVPGRVDNPLSQGPHQLLRDGAVLCARVEDVLDNLGPLPAEAHEPLGVGDGAGVGVGDGSAAKPQAAARLSASTNGTAVASTVAPVPVLDLPDRQQLVYDVLGVDAVPIDAIIEQTSLPAHIVLQELTFLTLRGVVKRIDGQTFARRR